MVKEHGVADDQDPMYFLLTIYPIYQLSIDPYWWRRLGCKDDIWVFWMVCSRVLSPQCGGVRVRPSLDLTPERRGRETDGVDMELR
jgi:hypothetical protein